MADSTHEQLRRRREALGLSLDQLSEVTAVPVDYLRALEDGALHQLPPGPYAVMYAASVRRCLERYEAGVDPDAGPPTRPSFPTNGRGSGEDDTVPSDAVVHTRPVPPSDESPSGIPLPVVRTLAMVSTLGFVVLLLWQGVVSWERWTQWADRAPPSALEVRVQVQTNARLRVMVDGQLVAHRRFAGGEDTTFSGMERVSVDVPNLAAARVWFNGRRVMPRGHQDRPRTLAFVNDGGTP